MRENKLAANGEFGDEHPMKASSIQPLRESDTRDTSDERSELVDQSSKKEWGEPTRSAIEERESITRDYQPRSPDRDSSGACFVVQNEEQRSDEAVVGVGPPVDIPNHELIRRLGAGGFGEVWLARHTLTEHYRACKLIPLEKAIELEGLRRLKQQVSSHANLFPIEDVGAVEGWLYCLMPLADAASTDMTVLDPSGYTPLTLRTYLERHGRRPTKEVAQIGLELAAAISHLHNHGVTHGDIKPMNIMRANGRWMLADYGLARDLASPSGGGHTPGYCPPAPDRPGTSGADQFALGVVLMELLTNRPAKTLTKFLATPIDELRLEDQGERLVEIVRRATAALPEDRFGSIEELASELRKVTESNERRRPWGGIAATYLSVVAVAILLVAAWINRSTGEAPQGAATASPLTEAIEVELFEIRHYRYDPVGDKLIPMGPIKVGSLEARSDDDVTVHGRFSGPAYFYLLSLDADGQVRLRIPALPTNVPQMADRFDYPSDPVVEPAGWLYSLNAGHGTQGFMLLASPQPLPSWSDWIAAHGEPNWTMESLPAGGLIRFDGTETRFESATREPMPRRSQLILDPINWARAHTEFSQVRFIAFPVTRALED